MEAGKEIAKVGSAGANLLLWGVTLFAAGAIITTGVMWAKKRADKRSELA